MASPFACTVAFAGTTGMAGAAPSAIKSTAGEKVKDTPHLKKRKPFNLGIDLKPYLAIITLLFIAVKTGYARTSLSPLKYSNLL